MDGDINRNQPLFDTQNRIFLSARSPISNHQLDRQSLEDSFSNTILTQQEICEISNRLIPVYINMNRRETMEEHSTIYYDTPELVLRRGQEFSCILIFNQAFQPDKYQLIIVFKPQTWRNFPVVKIPLNESSNGWSVKIIDTKDENQKKNQLHLRVYSSPNALIGKYSLFMEIRSADKEEPCVFQFESEFYLICNPWKEEDSCGLLSSDQIAEYVMNEHGEIYLGSSEIPQSIPWYFGQFESPVLPTALTILNRMQLTMEQRIDISIILRILAARICSDPGTTNGIFRSLLDVQPLSCTENAYTSSPAILKQFATSNGRSVAGDSGTNWQHAAVFCSLCRSLGIPCRVVTIYNAISDAKSNSNITCPWHLWNECWIRRDDVPKENSGWQVMDSSFNPTDTKTRRLGPCSVLALKNGSLDLKCDTPAIHSLVNGNQKLADDAVKRKILTKSPKDNQGFDDLTSDYTSSKASNSTSSNQEVQIDIDIPDSLKPSENLTVILKTNNQSNAPQTLALALSLFRINPIEQIRDNQGHRIPIQSFNKTFRLDPNQPKTIPLKVAENHQVWTGCFDSVLQLAVQGRIQETGQNYRREKYILNGENISMKLVLEDDVIEIGQSTKLNIEIKNSPSHTWNHGHITVDGFGILESLSIRKDSSSNDSTKIPFRVVPTRMGLGRLYVTFSTESLCLPPQTILLEVTGWSKKKLDTDYHLPAKQSSLQELRKTPADEESLGNDNQPEDNLSSTSGIFTAPNEQQETSVISTSEENAIPITEDEQQKTSQESDEDTSIINAQVSSLEKEVAPNEVDKPSGDDLRPTLINEELGKSNETSSDAAIIKELPLESAEAPQSKTDIVAQTIKIEEISQEQDAPDKSPSAALKETVTRNEDANERPELEITTFPEPVSTPSVQVTVDETKTKDEGSEVLQSSAVNITDVEDKEKDERGQLGLTATETTNIDRETGEEREKPLKITSSDNITTEENKGDDQTTLSVIPKVDQTVTETTIVEDTTTKSIDQTSSIQDKNEDEEKRSPQEIPTSSVTVETTTESTTSEKDKKDTEEPITSAPTSYNITRTETEQKVIEPLIQSGTTAEKKEDDQSKQLETPSTDRTIETIITKEQSPTLDTTDEKKQDSIDTSQPPISSLDTTTVDKTKISDVPVVDNKIEVVTKVTTVEDAIRNDQDQGLTTNADTKVEIPQETKQDDESKLPEILPLQTSPESITEVTTVETVSDTKQAEVPQNLSTDFPDKSVTDQDRANDETQQLEKTLPLNTAAEIIVNKQEDITSPLLQTVADQPALKEASFIITTTETVTETKPIEDRQETSEEQQQTTSPKETTLETPTETLSQHITSEDQGKDEVTPTDDTPKPPVETTPGDEKTDIKATAPAVQEDRDIPANKLPTDTSPLNLAEKTPPTETMISDETDVDKKETMVQSSPLDSTPLSKTAEPVKTEDKQEVTDITTLKTASPDDTTEADIVEQQKEDEKTTVSKISSADETLQTMDAIPPVQQEDKIEDIKSFDIPAIDIAIETNLQTVTTEPSTPKKETEKLVETVTEGDDSTNTTSSDTTKELIPTVSKTSSSEESKADNEAQLQSADRLEAPLAQPLLSEVEGTDAEPSMSEASSFDNVSEVPYKTYVVDDEAEDRDTDLPKFPNRNAALKAATDISSTEPGNRLTPASRCYSVETVIDTVTVGDKTEEVELIVLKPQSWYDSTTSLNSTTTDTDNETSEQEGSRPDGTNVETTTPSYRTKTVTQTVKVGDQDEEVETIILKAPSLNDITETSVESTATDNNATDLEKKAPEFSSSEPQLTKGNAIPSVQEESEITTQTLSDTLLLDEGPESSTETLTTEGSNDDTVSARTEPELAPEKTETLNEAVPVDRETLRDEENPTTAEDTEPSMSEASSFDNVSKAPYKTYVVDEEAEDRDTDLPKFPNRNAALKAATDMSSTEPGNRLTPASRCYSVETVIDTVTVGDKTEEVELIVLKPQSWYDSTTSLNSTTTDTDNETSEQEGIRPDGTSVETTTPSYRTKTVTQTVKVGDQDEEVETIILKAPSLNDVSETSAETATTEKDTTDQETKSSESEVNLRSVVPAAEDEKSSNTPSSDTGVEIIKQTETTEQKDDNAETPVTTALSQPDLSETSVETVTIDDQAAHGQEDLLKIPTVDPVASSVQDVKEAELSIPKSFARPSTSEVEETDTDPFISEASSFENLSEVPYRTYVVDDETEDRDTDLPKFPNRNAATDMSSTQAGQPLTRASRCYSVETVIDTVTVGDKTEEVELIVLKPQAWYDSTISLNEPTTDADNQTSDQQGSRVEGATPDYHTETVTQTVKVGDQDEVVETIVLKASSLDDITGKSEKTKAGNNYASDQETRSADLSSSEPQLNKSSTLSLIEEEKLSNAPSLDGGIETVTPIVATEQRDNDAEPQAGDRLEETLAQPVTGEIEHTDTEPSMSEASSLDNVSEVPYRTHIADDEMEDHDTDLPKFPNRNAALKAATDMSSTEPGNRLTPASRCYSVETVIDTVTVGDKTEEVELIVLKPQAWYDSTTSLNEPTTDADNQTSEQQGSRVEDATPDYRTKTVTQTVKVGDQDEEVETIILKAPSLTDISEKPEETATTDKDATDLKTNLSSISSSEERTENTSLENPAGRILETEKQSSPSQPVPETKNAGESTVDSEKRKSWKVPSLGDQIETEIPSIEGEGKNNDEEMVLQKVPSTDEIAPKTKQITNIEQRKDGDQSQPSSIQQSTIEEKSSSKLPSLDITTDGRRGNTGTKLPTTDSVTELQTTEETRESNRRPLFKVPSLGDIMDILTMTRIINNGEPDERMAISEPASVQNITEMFPDVFETPQTNEDERRSSPDISSLNKIGNTKEANRRSLPKVPSLGDIPETILRASPVEGKKEEERRFPNIPSLDIGTSNDDKQSKDIETETVTTTVEDKEKNDLMTLSGSPYIGNINNIVADIIGTPLETPSSSTINTVTETSTTEERRPSQEYTILRVPSLENIVGASNNLEEADRRKLPKVPSLEDMTEHGITTTTTTTTVEEIKPEERKLAKIPSLNLVSDTVSQKENTGDAKGANESELLASSSLEMPTKTVPEVTTIEEHTESNGRRLPKVPSLEDVTQTVPVATTDADEQNEEKRKLSRVPSLGFTTETLTKPIITEVKQEDEEKTMNDDAKLPETEEKNPERQSPDISSTSSAVETISGPSTINIPAPENVLLDCSFETVPRKVETEIQSVPPEKEDESSSLTESTIVSSVFETVQPTANNDETTTEETFSTASTFESEPVTLEKTDSTTDDADSSASTIQQDTTTTDNVTSSELTTTTTTEETKTDGESDSSAEDLKGWLDGLLQQLSAADETERDGEVSIIRSSAQLATPPVAADTTADVQKIKETTEFNDDTNNENDASEKSISEDLRSWLDDRLQQLSTTEETSTKIEPAESNALVEKTTVITETTTTNGEDSPIESSSRILKYLVLQTGTSDDSDVDDESNTEENNDSIMTVVATETPLSTSNSTTRVTTDNTVNIPEGETIVDRAYINAHRDANLTGSDGSAVAIISDDEGQNSRGLDPRTNSMSTMKDADSFSDTMATEIDHDVSHEDIVSLIQYADVLSDDILESAVLWTINDSYDTTPSGSPTHYTSSEQFIISESSLITDEPKLIANTSIKFPADNEETISDKSNGQ